MKSLGLSAIFLLSLCTVASALNAAPRHEAGRLYPSLNVVTADTTKTKKERVRKEIPPPPPEEESGTQTVVSESEGGFWDQCLSGCLSDVFGALLGSICSGIFGGKDDDSETGGGMAGEYGTPVPADMRAPAGALAPIEGFPYAAIIKLRAKGESTIWLWDRPGGYYSDGKPVESIPRGTEIRVTDYEVYGQTTWLQVSRLESDARQGWVQQTEVELPGVIEEAPAGGEQRAPATIQAPKPFAETPAREDEYQPAAELGGEPSAGQPRWEIGAGLSMPVFAQKEVREEYDQDGVRIGIQAGVFLPRSMKLRLCIDYLHADGTPLCEYVAGTTSDSPEKSDLDILSIGLPFGQLLRFAGGKGFFGYGLGPALFMVRESALIQVYEIGVWDRTRTDRLTKWKAGGEAVVAVGGVLGDRWPLSFQTRLAFIPWEADEEKSLTLDFLGTKDIAFFSFGIGIGFSLF